jgi:hypothetical protein
MEEKPTQFSIRGLLTATTIASPFFFGVVYVGWYSILVFFCVGFGCVLVGGSLSGTLDSDWPEKTLLVGICLIVLGVLLALFAYAIY